jgi:DNA-binding transcriptional LysR family regulator
MELRHLRAFDAVARTSSFTAAAAELHYAQSSITEQIQTLEGELGTRLFERSGRRPALTPAGERLLEYSGQVLRLVAEAHDAVRRQDADPSGTLVVGGLETLCVHRIPSILSSYRDRFSRVRVTVRQDNRGKLYESVRRGEIDVSFTFGSPPPDQAYASVALSEERLMIVTPPGHRLSAVDEVGPADLSGEPFLATEPGCGFREMFDSSLGGGGTDGPLLTAEVASIAALCACVASGMGLALLPEMVVQGPAQRGELFARPLRADTARTAVTMTWLRRREDTPSLARFIDLATTAA